MGLCPSVFSPLSLPQNREKRVSILGSWGSLYGNTPHKCPEWPFPYKMMRLHGLFPPTHSWAAFFQPTSEFESMNNRQKRAGQSTRDMAEKRYKTRVRLVLIAAGAAFLILIAASNSKALGIG